MKTLLVIRQGRFYSPDPHFGKQQWQRASYLCPLPCPKFLRPALHTLSRWMRSWWPLWYVYAVQGRRLGRLLGYTGIDLIAAELSLTQ